MPSKKQGRKPKPAQDPDARIKEFAARFWQYSDAEAKKFDIKPDNWPRIFPLKIGGNIVGRVVMNWGAVLDKIAHVMKPDAVSDEEYVAAMQSGEPEVKQLIALPLMLIAFHVFECLPEKLNQATLDLTLEGYIKDSVRRSKEHKIKLAVTPSKSVEKIGASEVKRIKERLGIGRGGARDRRKFEDGVDLGLLVHYVDSMRPFWEYVVKFFALHHYDEDCISWIKDKSDYQQLSQSFEVPDSLLRQVYRRKSESKPALEPLGLAVSHARSFLGITWAHSTVTKRYKVAKRQLKKSSPPDSPPTSST